MKVPDTMMSTECSCVDREGQDKEKDSIRSL